MTRKTAKTISFFMGILSGVSAIVMLLIGDSFIDGVVLGVSVTSTIVNFFYA